MHLFLFVCTEVSCHDKNSADSIDQMFEEVLEYVERMEGGEDYHDGSAGAQMKTEPEEQTNQQEPERPNDCEDIEEELLTFPPSGILSPLSKSVEAVVTPLVRSALTGSSSSVELNQKHMFDSYQDTSPINHLNNLLFWTHSA